MFDPIRAVKMGWADKGEWDRERECVTERNTGYFINTKSRPCVSHCPWVELSDCNTRVLCYCKQDVLYCYCCPFREEFSFCDLQPSDREQRSQDLLIENKFASSKKDFEKHHGNRRGFFCFVLGWVFLISFFFFPRGGKSRVLLLKDRIKKTFRGQSELFRLFKGKQKD